MRVKILLLSILFLFSGFPGADAGYPVLALSPEVTQHITTQIFQNECGSKDEYLLQWNEGEDFLSLGIGHFIWYPEDETGPFEESFPGFVGYLKSMDVPLPDWLEPGTACPWKSRKDFLSGRQGRKLEELRQVILTTKSLQGQYIIRRFDKALPKMLEKVLFWKRAVFKKQYSRMASTPEGIYAMIDYSNFKGLGTVRLERYKGHGWGLKQVLLRMKGDEGGHKVIEEFVRVAEDLLAQRIKNAPGHRNEGRWFPGWQNRVRSYLKFSTEPGGGG